MKPLKHWLHHLIKPVLVVDVINYFQTSYHQKQVPLIQLINWHVLYWRKVVPTFETCEWSYSMTCWFVNPWQRITVSRLEKANPYWAQRPQYTAEMVTVNAILFAETQNTTMHRSVCRLLQHKTPQCIDQIVMKSNSMSQCFFTTAAWTCSLVHCFWLNREMYL